MILLRAKVRNKKDYSTYMGVKSVVKNMVKGKLCRCIPIFILLSLLFPSCVSAQCGECDDRDSCTRDYCNGTECLHVPMNCEDKSQSTWNPYGMNANINQPGRVGSFNPFTNAAFGGGEANCSDGNPCTRDYYGLNGCVHDPLNCNDGNPCTMDNCGANGCVQYPVNCDDGNPCTTDSCGGYGGCVHDPMICDDGNPCTVDYCGANGCVHDPVNCDDSNPCTTDHCGVNSCVHDLLNCDDGNPCTTDYCGANGCINDPMSCDDGNPCTTDSCGANGCVHDPMICDDGNFGIADASGSCSCGNSLTSSDNANAMPSSDSANASAFEPWEPGVSNTDIGYSVEYVTSNESQSDKENPIVIGSGDNITTEFSNQSFSAKYYQPDCDDNDSCTIDIFDGKACVYTLKDCDDANDSTLDSCQAGACINLPVVLSGEDNITTEFSNQSFSARHYQPDCNDNDNCTIDTFNGNVCVNTPKDCDDKNATTFDYCYEGNCVHILKNCDDGSACTTDSYNGTDCVHTSTYCVDNNPCTINSCDPVTGCKYVPIICDDGKGCTTDYCDGHGNCVHKQISCGDGNPCTIDYCDSVWGCVHALVVCEPGKICINGFCQYPYYTYPYPYPYPYVAPYTEPYKTSQPTESYNYTIPAGSVVTLPWGAKVTALETLKVENGIAYSSAPPLRFVRLLGQNQTVSGNQSDLSMSDQAEMIGLTWQASPFSVVLIQPDGSVLPVKGDGQKVLHLIGSNYDYYFLHEPAKGNWSVDIWPRNSGTGGEGFSLITGLVRGAAPLPPV
jgi:hypothetical protein